MSTAGRVPFSNGTEVDWFRSARCERCVFDSPDGGGCDAFALGVGMGQWPGLLVEVERGVVAPANPLGIECTKFTRGPHGSRFESTI